MSFCAVPLDPSVELSKIRTDGGTQARAGVDQPTVDSYVSEMDAGAIFPPVTVFYDGEEYWLADGFHRVAAAKKIGYHVIRCDVRAGTRRDAILFACGANATNGLRRTNADKRRAVEILLGDDDWAKKSDRWIAEKCGVHHQVVAKMRPAQLDESSSSPRIGQDGKTRKLPEKPTPAPAPAPSKPPAPRQPAQAAQPMRTAPVTKQYRPEEQDERENEGEEREDAEQSEPHPVVSDTAMMIFKQTSEAKLDDFNLGWLIFRLQELHEDLSQ